MRGIERRGRIPRFCWAGTRPYPADFNMKEFGFHWQWWLYFVLVLAWVGLSWLQSDFLVVGPKTSGTEAAFDTDVCTSRQLTDHISRG